MGRERRKEKNRRKVTREIAQMNLEDFSGLNAFQEKMYKKDCSDSSSQPYFISAALHVFEYGVYGCNL